MVLLFYSSQKVMFELPQPPPLKKLKKKPFARNPAPQPTRDPIIVKITDDDNDDKNFVATLSDDIKIENSLTENGFVIIENVINENECRQIIDGVWESMEAITADLPVPFDRNKPETWRYAKQQENVRNMYRSHGIAHSSFMWKLRQHPNVLLIFSRLYGCKDLLVSFDGLSMQTPPETTIGTRGWYANNSWYHVDQSYTRPKKECFQSWITARDVNPGDYTIGFFAKSHKSFEEFGKKFNVTKKDNFYKLTTQEEMDFYESRHQQIRIACPAGSLVLWDSRMLHSGLQPLPNRKKPNFRTVCFLSYLPRHRVPRKIIEKRISFFEKRIATGHWSDSNMKKLYENANFFNPLIKKLETEPPETEMLRSLVGYEKKI